VSSLTVSSHPSGRSRPNFGFGACSTTCGQGQSTRVRTIVHDACNDGKPCPRQINPGGQPGCVEFLYRTIKGLFTFSVSEGTPRERAQSPHACSAGPIPHFAAHCSSTLRRWCHRSKYAVKQLY
jgi:hypothetical protein